MRAGPHTLSAPCGPARIYLGPHLHVHPVRGLLLEGVRSTRAGNDRWAGGGRDRDRVAGESAARVPGGKIARRLGPEARGDVDLCGARCFGGGRLSTTWLLAPHGPAYGRHHFRSGGT